MNTRWQQAEALERLRRASRRVQASPLGARAMRHLRPAPAAEPGASVPILEQYVDTAPCAQNAVDIFGGEWSSTLPEHLGVHAGAAQLFADGRIEVAADHLGGVADLDILELGPLEGGHTWMLCQKGARSVTAVEANSRAYLKCLITKELLGMPAAHFLFGDFLAYLREVPRRFDALLASGVLYHMQDPIGLLEEMGRHSDRLILWTHYYDPAVLTPAHDQHRMFDTQVELRGVDGDPVVGHRHSYHEGLASQAFCGSGSTWSIWLERPTILATLEAMGYANVRIDMDQPDHQNGPSFLVTAWR